MDSEQHVQFIVVVGSRMLASKVCYAGHHSLELGWLFVCEGQTLFICLINVQKINSFYANLGLSVLF